MEGRGDTEVARDPGRHGRTGGGRPPVLAGMYGAELEVCSFVRKSSQERLKRRTLGKELRSTSIRSCMHRSTGCASISVFLDGLTLQLVTRETCTYTNRSRILEGVGVADDTPVSAHRTHSPQH
ncbi:hypothetical protein CGRA01v4_12599 [Colletotrichum graminicola]|nr:hypothetical protein CGRA01v4_12599 [Colletotrichum graminicola]